ncbi:MAG: HEAT repeat domain-containing protein, partial [Lentisphaeraceae bacterium]|nr:HEAT repeat domain-containing protein [Lentisphaeraceae bacterium]
MFSTIICLLPLIVPAWKEKPLPNDFLNKDTMGYESSSELIQYQNKALKFSDPQLRMEIIRQLALLENDEAQALMYRHLKVEKEASVRLALINYLANLAFNEKRLEDVELLVNDKTAEGIAAARLYCKFPKADLTLVLNLLDKVNAVDRISLLKALRLSGRLPLSAWMKLYSDKSSSLSRFQILQGLAAKTPTTASLELLLKVLKNSNVREKLAIALSISASEKTTDHLLQMANDSHLSIRSIAARKMADFHKPRFLAKLLKLAVQDDSEVRKMAYYSLRNYAGGADALLKGLDDGELFNQEMAFESLMELSHKTSLVAKAAKCISHKSINRRRWAGRLLGQQNKREFTAKIKQQLLREKNHLAQKEQLFALGEFKGELSAAQVDSLNKGHESVKAELMLYLGKIKNQKFYSYVEKAAVDKESHVVRRAAFTAIGKIASSRFNKQILMVMDDFDEYSGADRALACRAAG